ncbi:MAG: zf-HC2 domain-containing protein [Endomicrobia bacterium]|nr:zf-HC2 domain-containing protein [Endomicrobiia bacterium]MCL2506348.1 zf-HC2 domain-containing protein [Endomicrobiia bacterium]
MKCKKCVSKLSLYIDDKLPESEKILLEKHLKSCKECFKEYFLLKNVRTSLISLNKQKAGDKFESIIMQKIENNLYAPSHYSTLFQTFKVSLFAAAFLFGVIATFNFFTPSPKNNYDKYDKIAAIDNYVLKGTSASDKITSSLI